MGIEFPKFFYFKDSLARYYILGSHFLSLNFLYLFMYFNFVWSLDLPFSSASQLFFGKSFPQLSV